MKDGDLEVLIADLVREEHGIPENAFFRGYIVVAEWETLDGQPRLAETVSEDMPEWRRIGMLQYALTGDVMEDEESDE